MPPIRRLFATNDGGIPAKFLHVYRTPFRGRWPISRHGRSLRGVQHLECRPHWVWRAIDHGCAPAKAPPLSNPLNVPAPRAID